MSGKIPEKIRKEEVAADLIKNIKALGTFTWDEIESITYYVERDILGFGNIAGSFEVYP